MPELRSALSEICVPGRFGAGEAEAPLTLGERALGALFQIAGWPDGFEAAAGPVLRALGFAGVGGFGVAQSAGEAFAFRVAPERVLVRMPTRDPWDAATAGIDPSATPTVDLGHARAAIRIEGAAAADLLARLLPIDLHDGVFAPGRFALSGLHSVPVLLHRRGDDMAGPVYDLYVPYTWAASIWDMIAASAAPFGYRVTPAGG